MAKRGLRKGDRVTVYEDPETETKPEGQAVLVNILRLSDEGHEYWRVRFEGDSEPVMRWVKPR